jgi:hypothetical protein
MRSWVDPLPSGQRVEVHENRRVGRHATALSEYEAELSEHHHARSKVVRVIHVDPYANECVTRATTTRRMRTHHGQIPNVSRMVSMNINTLLCATSTQHMRSTSARMTHLVEQRDEDDDDERGIHHFTAALP